MRPAARTLECAAVALVLSTLACGTGGPSPDAPQEPARSTAQTAPPIAPYDAHREKFLAFYLKKDYASALKEATAALEAAPEHREAFMLVSKTFIESGRDAEAVPFFARLTVSLPSRADPWFFKGFHEARLERWDDAIASLERAVTLAPDDSEAGFRLGQALMQRGKLDRAVAELQRASELDPGSAAKAASLMIALAASGKSAPAEKIAADLLARLPDSAEARFSVAQLRLRQRRFGEAEALLRRALEINPAFAPARADLDRLLAQAGR
jgi:tetratricopeptide (TPR) repeat protein